ncbi:AraC-like DNA-binding protein [Flavobacterium sp. CG_9.1]|uniref:hypothetical protein n=1 Tax=Flavobacterium sp. CG_9.1 TaxID=2787728 RepID=UPI0018CA5424|nr:hypothetical protein [Flavobacterium sp. CG_9.1]MBG6063140.1 AraC-like DNA-binding protein [Flavobacterium sp. CG_9.1]
MVSKNYKYHHLGLQVHLFEIFTSKNAFSGLFIVDRFSILIVNSGYLYVEINSRNISMYLNDLIVIPKKATYKILMMSEQLRICQLSFTTEFIFENSIKRPHIGYFEFFVTQYPPKISLKNKEALRIIDLFKLMDSTARSSNKHLFRKEALLFSFNLLLYELAGIYNKRYEQISLRHTGREKLVLQFFKILEINFRKQHDVKFYADVLCITSGYLTKTIKAVTNKTAKQFIEEAIILEIKILLQNNDVTISSIVEEYAAPQKTYNFLL